MSSHLGRVSTGKVAASIQRDGRSYSLLENKHKNRVVARSIVVAGGSHAPRMHGASYRSMGEQCFDIDPIVVRSETDGDRFGKKLGLNVEALVGDPAIDERFYFETDTKPDVVRDLFSDPVLRASLVEALGLFEAVVIGPPRGVVAGVRGGALRLDDEARLQALHRLAGALPAIRVRAQKSQLARMAPQIFGSLLLQMGIGGGVFWSMSSRALVSPVVLVPLLLAITLALVLSFTVLLLIFRGRNSGFGPWLRTSLFLTVALGGLGVGLYNDLNHRMDPSTPVRYEVSVVRYRPHIKKKQSALLEVKGLPDSLVSGAGPGGVQEIDASWMPRADCKALELHVAPGHFGNPWVSKVSCAGG